MVRSKVQEYVQEILEEEIEIFLGRKKSERIKAVDVPPGYRNGYGKTKQFTVMNGTINIRRPRIRGTEEKFESKIIPFFKRRSKEVGNCCRSYTCMVWRKEILRWRCEGCWERERRCPLRP